MTEELLIYQLQIGAAVDIFLTVIWIAFLVWSFFLIKKKGKFTQDRWYESHGNFTAFACVFWVVMVVTTAIIIADHVEEVVTIFLNPEYYIRTL